MHPAVMSVLHERFGLDLLYPIQEGIVERILAGGSALVVLPTGSGKSLCYQLPALVRAPEVCATGALPRDGITLVFSPLIALMEDQVRALSERGLRAAFINSTLRRREREERYAQVAAGALDIVYCTPERMEKPEFAAALAATPGGVRLLAIDEAHCIARWGHDFRPAYQKVGEFRHRLGDPVTVALTATATAAVRDEIRAVLGLDARAMPLFSRGVDRPNLSFEVHPVWDEADKLEVIRDVADDAHGTVVVYFSLIKTLERLLPDVARAVPEATVDIYHGRLDARAKRRIHERFAGAPAADRLLLLATNAFGMGVDKPDIRAIVHAEVPGSVEAYTQEVGRAGRDGLPARCALLYDEQDLAIQQQFVDWLNPSAELLDEAIHHFQHEPGGDLHVDDLRARIIGRDRGDRRAEACVVTLEKMGIIEPTGLEGHHRFARVPEDGEVDPAEIAAKRERDLRRLLDVVHLVRCDDVRAFIVDYFDLEGPDSVGPDGCGAT